MRHGRSISLLALPLLLAGCSQKKDLTDTPPKSVALKVTAPAPAIKKEDPPAPVLPRVSDRKANTMGAVFVTMYHHIGTSRDVMFRTPQDFTSDLDHLYKLGFRPVLVSDLLKKKMPLASGASPVVMTFDDSNPDQIRLLKDGSLDPTCFMGVWSKFTKTHPDFPMHATFFVLPRSMFGQPNMLDKKLALIKKWGSEVANHTVHHYALRTVKDSVVQYEIVEGDKEIRKMQVPYINALALPFGSTPRNRKLLEKSVFDGDAVSPSGVFLVGANPSRSPLDPKFRPLAVPRIRGSAGRFALSYWFEQAEQGKLKLYVAP